MTLTFTAVGFFGVMAFPDKDIKGDVLQMLVNKGLLGSVARGGLVFAIGLSAPLIVHPTKLMFSNVYMFLFRPKTMSRILYQTQVNLLRLGTLQIAEKNVVTQHKIC